MGGRGSSSGNTSRLPKLPQLEGSEKQIKWAEDIRNEAMEEMKEYLKLFNNKEFQQVYKDWSQSENELHQDNKKFYDKFMKMVNEKRAGTWIFQSQILKSRTDFVADSIKEGEIGRGLRKIKEGKKSVGYGKIVRSIANRYHFW